MRKPGHRERERGGKKNKERMKETEREAAAWHGFGVVRHSDIDIESLGLRLRPLDSDMT